MLVLHYTGMASAAEALARLCRPEARVSAHYLIDEDGGVFALVDEGRRAWHAGVACWRGRRDVNAASIGIELANPGHEWGYRPFPPAQMRSLAALCRDILDRHAVPARHVLGHADVAPLRKCDPGELFDWRFLARAGVGLWPQALPDRGDTLGLGDAGGTVARFQRALARYGYCLAADGRYGDATKAVVTAFQRHFRPSRVDGRADAETRALLAGLLARCVDDARSGT